MDDFGLLFKLFDGLLPGMGGGGGMGNGGPVIIGLSGGGSCGNSGGGCEDGNCPPSSKSPRDDVLRNPNDRLGRDYPGQMGGGNIQSSSGSPRDDVLRPPRNHGNMHHQADGRNFEVFLPKVFDRFFGFPEESDNFGNHFSHRPDPFAPGAGSSLLFGNFDPFGMRRELRDWGNMDGRFDHQHQQQHHQSSRVFYKQSSTVRDCEGNRQVRTITRDGRGVETERVETHMPDGRVEVREERRNQLNADEDVKPLAGLKSYKQFLSKPLFKDEIFSFDKKPQE